jgi:hypothetical protein
MLRSTPAARLPRAPTNWFGTFTNMIPMTAEKIQTPIARQFHPRLNQYRPPTWRRLNTWRESASYQPRRVTYPIIIMIIHGAVQVMISTANVEMLCTMLKAKRPTKMKTMAIDPMNNVAWTRENLGKTLEKSRPVP